MLLAFLCKRGAVGESQSWESNFQVKSKSEELQESHFWQVFKHLFSVGWRRHHWIIQLHFWRAGKPPIFLSQVDKSGVDDTCLLYEVEKGEGIMLFLKFFRSIPQSCFWPLTLPNSQISKFVNLGPFFPLAWLLSQHLSPIIEFNQSLSKRVLLLPSVAMKLQCPLVADWRHSRSKSGSSSRKRCYPPTPPHPTPKKGW